MKLSTLTGLCWSGTALAGVVHSAKLGLTSDIIRCPADCHKLKVQPSLRLWCARYMPSGLPPDRLAETVTQEVRACRQTAYITSTSSTAPLSIPTSGYIKICPSCRGASRRSDCEHQSVVTSWSVSLALALLAGRRSCPVRHVFPIPVTEALSKSRLSCLKHRSSASLLIHRLSLASISLEGNPYCKGTINLYL